MLRDTVLAGNVTDDLTHLPLLAAIVGLLLAVVAAGALVALLKQPISFPRHAGPWRNRVLWGVAGGVATGGAVLAATWHLKVPHTAAPIWVVRGAIMLTFVTLGVASVNFRRTPLNRKMIGTAATVLIVLVASVAVNIDRIGTPVPANATASTAPTPPPGSSNPAMSKAAAARASGESLPALTLPGTVKPTPDLATYGLPTASTLYRSWHPPASMPTHGTLEAVNIPGLVSHFVARTAEVYLPPAALVAHAPALPVLILLSGQPADPLSVIQRGHALATLNALAARNHGLAPILVVPDQLGQPQLNPMCVDSPLGNAGTYIMTDVTGWIRTHLHVLPGRDAWAIGGFSEGGTCAIQFATAYPQVFGSLIDVSGERYPTLGSDSLAISEGFSGSTALYNQAKPENIMTAHVHYNDMVAVFAVGGKDAHYGAIMPLMSAAAAAHGIYVSRYISVDTAHDWTTASNGFAAGIGTLYQRFGLSSTGQYLSSYPPTP